MGLGWVRCIETGSDGVKRVKLKNYATGEVVEAGERGGNTSGCWPQRAELESIHPKQADSANRKLAALGVKGVYYGKDGVPVIESRSARKRWMRAVGKMDNQAGYGDWGGSGGKVDYQTEMIERLEYARRKGT